MEHSHQQSQPQYQDHPSLLEIKPDHDAVLSQLKQEEELSPLEENQDSQQQQQMQQQQLQQLQQQHMNGNINSCETSLPSVEITEYSPEWAYPEVSVAIFWNARCYKLVWLI